MPFKPTPGRPIYCEDCLTKIQAGELKPVSMTELKREEQRMQESKAELADLGIEFERAAQKRPAPQPQRPQQFRPQAPKLPPKT